MKRTLFILFIFVLLISSVFADTSDLGKVRIEILNRPPQVKDIDFVNKQVYPDSELKCNAEIIDEVPSSVELDYNWYRNGKLMNIDYSSIKGFNPGEKITCEITPVDKSGLKGNSKKISVTVKKTPVKVKLANPVLKLVGRKKTTSEIMNIQPMNSITGNVVGSRGSGLTDLIIPVFIVLMIFLNLHLWIRINQKKFIVSNTP